MYTRTQQRRGNAAEWTSVNPILADGEIGFERDTGRFKIGDGVVAWTALEYSAVSEALLDDIIAVAIAEQHEIDNDTYRAVIKPEMFGTTGTANDTAVLQTAFDMLRGSALFNDIELTKAYNITAAINMGLMVGKKIIGSGTGLTGFVQQTDGVPIINFDTENAHDLKFENVYFAYATADPTNAGSVAMALSVVGGTGAGIYRVELDGCDFYRCYKGVGTTGTGSLALWGWDVHDSRFRHIKQTAVDLSSPVTIGMPRNRISHVYISNTGSAVVSTGPAINIAGSELFGDSWDIEGWQNTILAVAGGVSGPIVTGIHVESHVFTGGGRKNLIQIADTKDCQLVDVTAHATSSAAVEVDLIRANAGASVTVRGLNANFPAGPTSLYYGSTDASAGARVSLSGLGTNGAFAATVPQGLDVRVLDIAAMTGAYWPVQLGKTNSAGLRGDAFLIIVPFPMLVSAIATYINTATAGNFQAAIYSADGATKLAATASTAFGSLTAASVNVVALIGGALSLAPGAYWVAQGSDNSNLTYGLGNSTDTRCPSKQQLSSSVPLPASIAGWSNASAALGPVLVGV
jgi:hypothetical protein